MNKRFASFTLFLILYFTLFQSYIAPQCSDFEKYKKDQCESLVASENKKCNLINGKCISSYLECSDYTSETINENICKSIIPSEPLYKCIVQNNKCIQALRQSNEYLEETEEICKKLEPGVNKRYIFINNKCELHYNKCEDYKVNVQKNICENNIPSKERYGYNYDDYLTKCVYNNGLCKSEKRTCTDLKSTEEPSFCYSLSPIDETKKCVFTNGKCIENFSKCENYIGNIDQTICESIIPFIDGNFYPDSTHKCVKIDNNCIQTDRFCEDYKSGEEECEYLSPRDETKRCVLIKNQCIEQYRNCNDYIGNDENICKSIKPLDEYDSIDYSSKCEIENGNCIKKRKLCSDYISGEEISFCESIILENNAKRCFYYNNNCIEEYKSCNDYKGNDKNICESILIFDYNNKIDLTKKCVYKDNQCIKESKLCSEFQNDYYSYELCHKLSTNDSSKTCIFYENKCIETYVNCEDYDTNVNEDKCKSIIPQNYLNIKCEFKNNKCVSEYKSCNELDSSLLKNKCEDISVGVAKKCSYVNNNCIETYKYCLDLEGEEINEGICRQAATSSNNKRCYFNSDLKKCEETNKDSKNNAKIYKINLFGIILCLLNIFQYNL